MRRKVKAPGKDGKDGKGGFAAASGFRLAPRSRKLNFVELLRGEVGVPLTLKCTAFQR